MPPIGATTAVLRPAPWMLQALDSPRFLPAALVLALVLRVAVLLVPLEQSSDFEWYFMRAAGIARGEGYHQGGVLTAFWPVGWPGALGLLFSVTGVSALAGQLANLVMGVLACGLAASLAARLFGSRAAGNLAALMMAVYPNQIGYVPLLSTEIFYETLLLLSVLLLMRERLASDLACGVLLGIGTLTKTQTLLLPGFLLVVLIVLEGWKTLPRRARSLCAIYVALLLVVAPWTYRNWVVFDAFVPVSTNGGFTLMTGNNPEARGDYTPETVLAVGFSHDPTQQIAMDRMARERAVAWIKDNPGRFIMLMPLKVFRLWAPDGEAEWFYQRGSAIYDANYVVFRIVRGANQVFYLGILALALPSMWLLWRRRAALSPWAWTGVVFCLYFTLISMVFSGQSRFHFSLMPFVIGYASWTLARWGTAWSLRRQAWQPDRCGPGTPA